MPQTSPNLFIVGVGASAGGLDALTRLVAHLPRSADSFAVIIAQHLSPDHKSRMVDLLSRTSRWKVEQAEDGEEIAPKTVYMTPPEHEVAVKNNTIQLTRHQREKQSVPSVDRFFESLAGEYGNRAIGVVLSGTGSDGTEGCKAIKEQQGYVLVQDTEEAQHDSMPASVIKAGVYNKVLLAEQMGDEISRYLDNYKAVNGGGDAQQEDSLREIFKLMTKKTGTDFSRYKPSTIKRRIQRRLEALKLESVDDYWAYIQTSPVELDELYKTVLIGVTGFFRDDKAFEALKKYLAQILDQKEPGEGVRIWSVGCATGEEPYSIAILLEEMLEERKEDHQVQIFATDVDEYALNIGRKGYYTHEQIQDMPRDLLRKYFTTAPNGYEIKKHIRQMVLFSKHDITVDPPFVRLDLLTCRNLLIYFDQELQKEIFPVFHYALQEGGYLLLGKSENVSDQTDLFGKIDSKQKIFLRKKGAQNTLKFSKFRKSKTADKDAPPQPRPELSVEEIAEQTLIRTYEHPYVVVDENLEVAYIKGKLQPYTDLGEGTIDSNLLRITNKDLHMEIRTLFAKCKKQYESLTGSVVKIQLNEEDRYVRLKIKPLIYTRNNSHYFMIIFEKVEEQMRLMPDKDYTSWEDDWKAMRITELEQELSATKEHLHTFTEELETSNEELQSLNEELQSANEELKSSNEELETSNEELQSANEELSTANSELNHSNEALLQKENELTNIKEDLELTREKFYLALENTNIFLFYQNADLEYSWVYNPFPPVSAEQMIGKTDLELKWVPRKQAKHLHNIKQQAIDQQSETEVEVKIADDWYDLKIMPHIQGGKVTGIYGVGIGITERKTAADIIERNESTMRSIINQGIDNIIAVDLNFNILTANNNIRQEFYDRFKVQVRQGDNLLECLRDFPDAQAMSRHNFDKTFRGETVDLGTFASESPDGKVKKYFEGSFFPLYDQDKKIIGGVNIGREVTERVILEQQVQEIIKRSANLTGKAFFEDLTAQLTNVFDMRYVYVGIYHEEEDAIRTFALRIDGELSDDFRYTLPRTPCGRAIDREKQLHLEGVQRRFPDDEKLQRWNVESYVGIPIESSQQDKSLGVLVMMDDEPWNGSPYSDYLLALFSLRAGAELERMRAEREVREKGMQLDNIASNVPGILYELLQPEDGKVRFTYISNNCEKIFEYTQEELYQDADLLASLMTEKDLQRYLVAKENAIRDQQLFRFECRIHTHKTGQHKWVKFDSRAIKTDKGEIYWYGFIEDISALKQVEAELLQAKETAEKAARAKEDFLSTMSHEIRTPLNAIIGLSQLLLRRNPRTDQLENLNTLKYSSQNLMGLINDILDFSKLEAGNVELDITDYDLRQMMESIRQAHMPHAEDRKNTLVLSVDQEVPEVLRGDQLKIGQVLNNLVSNANKFTHQGTIEIKVCLLSQQDDAVELKFVVRDNGIGITPEKLERIFEKFTQADSSTQRQYGDTGLGLSITRALLRLMGSDIQVQSREHDGSEFFFNLRQQPGAPEKVRAQEVNTTNEDIQLTQSSVKVLLVEDVAINRLVVQQYFEEWWNIVADEATNGREAVDMAQDKEYDLILMDIRMPEMDGYEAVEKIRAMAGHNAQVPILALTADTGVIDRRNGFNDVLTKPFNPDELREKIIAYTSTKIGTSEKESAPTDTGKASREVNGPDFAKAEANFEEVSRQLKFYRMAISNLETYQQQYEKAIQTRDKQLISDTMHKAKVLFSLLGLEHFYQEMYSLREKMEAGDDMRSLEAETQQVVQRIESLREQIRRRMASLDGD